ncbi:MAG: cyclic nucleotide-binding domain-containing protein [Acidobacteria bacterium]|nr:cyclic nucleotide-binding domain-containing protein [Acidobacteriota bacterium]
MPELNIVEKVISLEGVELLSGLTPEQLARIASVAREKRIPPGKVIFDGSKPMDALYVVIDGSVELSREGEVLVEAGPNHVLGTWALFDEDAMAVTATTRDEVRLLRISRDDFYDLLADNIEIAASLFSTLVRRFRKLVEEAPAVHAGA